MSTKEAGHGNVLELTRPPARRNRFGRRWIIGGSSVLALIVALILVLTFSPVLAIKSVEVKGNKLVSGDVLRSELAPLLGVPLSQVGSGRVLGLLKGEPAIADVVIQAEAPGTLHVQVVEYEPVAVLQEGSKFSLVGADGRVLVPLAKRGAVKLPVIKGNGATADPKVFAVVTKVLSELPEDLLAKVDHASAESRDFVELKLTNGRSVVWGDGSRGRDKALVLEALLGVKDKSKKPVRVYDVSSPDHPVTR